MAKKIKIRTKSERVLLSEVLPYETPVTFSNKHFYNFLITNEINNAKLQDKKISCVNKYFCSRININNLPIHQKKLRNFQ